MASIALHASRRQEDRGPEIVLAAALGLTVVLAALAAWTMPAAVIPFVASLAMLASGFGLAFAARNGRLRGRRLAYRDAAAILVFFGFVAALLGEPAALLG